MVSLLHIPCIFDSYITGEAHYSKKTDWDVLHSIRLSGGCVIKGCVFYHSIGTDEDAGFDGCAWMVIPGIWIDTSLQCTSLHQRPHILYFPFIKNGCLSASAGVHLFSGFKFKQRSKRSTNSVSSFSSPASIPLFPPMTLLLRSRVGLITLMTLMTSLPEMRSLSTDLKFSRSSK